MATAAYGEIEAFLCKYCKLTSFGVNSNINFSSVNGNVFVSFSAELGSIISPTSTPRSSLNSSKRSHQKPSKIKGRVLKPVYVLIRSLQMYQPRR